MRKSEKQETAVAKEMIYPQLPEDILIYLFSFLRFSEKMRLDSAMTNHKLREGWDELLKRRIFNQASDLKLWRREEIKSYGERSEFRVLSLPKAINTAESQLFILYSDSWLKVWNLATGITKTTKISCIPSEGLFLSTGHMVTCRQNQKFERWNLETNSVQKCKDSASWNNTKVRPILLKNDLIAYFHENKWIKIINPLKEWTCENTCYCIVQRRSEIKAMFGMTKKMETGVSNCIIFWSNYDIHCWNYEDDGIESKLIFEFPPGSSSVTFFKDCQPLHESHRIVTLNSNAVTEVWNLETNLVEVTFSLIGASCGPFHALKDERLMVRIPNDNKKSPDIFQVWNLKGKDSPQEPNLVLKPDRHVVCYDVMKSNENETLVTVDSEGGMHFWNLDTGAYELFKRPRHVRPFLPSRNPTIQCLPKGKIAINASSALEIWKPIKQ